MSGCGLDGNVDGIRKEEKENGKKKKVVHFSCRSRRAVKGKKRGGIKGKKKNFSSLVLCDDVSAGGGVGGKKRSEKVKFIISPTPMHAWREGERK